MRKKKKTISVLKKNARYWFQRYVRLSKLKSNTTCIYECGKKIEDITKCDAAHYLKAELYSTGIFDYDNVHISCKGCNIQDPTIEYRKGLIKRYGENFVKKLEGKHQRTKGRVKWERIFLENLIIKYKKLCKEIEK